jgi:hypothetical protein
MKMSGFIVMLLLGLAVCAYLVRVHGRPVPVPPAASALAAPRTDDLRPVDAWQRSLKLTTPNDDSPETKHLMEQLRREEARQQPQEGRN